MPVRPHSLPLLLFPVATLVCSGIAFFNAEQVSATKPAIVPLLSFIMFSMGLTLKRDDYQRVAKRYKVVSLGVLAQYTIMPLAAFLIGHAFAMDEQLLAGLVLVGCCPGGTASNVIAYLSKADVALSITLTAVSTVISVLATPLLCWLLLGQSIEVDVGKMLWNLTTIVLLPVSLGGALNLWCSRFVKPLHGLLPVLSMAAIVAVIAIVVALNQEQIATISLIVVAAVMLHNLSGLVAGYWVSRLAGYDQSTCRTVGIEVGMQNSGLAVALALLHFSPLAALPGAIFSVWHNLSGSILASIWGTSTEDQSKPPDEAESQTNAH